MALGIYLDNLSDLEDTGEPVKETIAVELSPDFKNRHTIQLWKTMTPEITINRWVGETLAENSAHEIVIVNNSLPDVLIKFDLIYNLYDDDFTHTKHNEIIIALNETAHYYATAIYGENGNRVMVMRVGTQDTRTK
ncbi:MAG: hypothetical protein KAH32_06025 [Chlamydiia bacterium]|nr:hypothetical protein [Chlamydiia bacterium]